MTHLAFVNKFLYSLVGMLVPVRWIEKWLGKSTNIQPDDFLTIAFTSGVTGDPKGVMLSHFNIGSNVEAVAHLIPWMGQRAKLLVTFPPSQSFGYLIMWLGINHGIPLVLHHDPKDCNSIGKLVHDKGVTLLVALPSLLKHYIPNIAPEQFGSLQCVLVGSEKLSNTLSEQFSAKFGLVPIAGYGLTECSPVVAASTLDVRGPGFYQQGSRPGSVGRPLPGVSIRVVDQETFDELPFGNEGLLLVKGPNVMMGYIGDKEGTKDVYKDNWLITDDIGSVDNDGFVEIVDRSSRFRRFGDELFSYISIEDTLYELSDSDPVKFAVTLFT